LRAGDDLADRLIRPVGRGAWQGAGAADHPRAIQHRRASARPRQLDQRAYPALPRAASVITCHCEDDDERRKAYAHSIDAVSGTDGIDATSASLGPAFPQGMFIAQDGENDGCNQNFKFVPWHAIANAIGPAGANGPATARRKPAANAAGAAVAMVRPLA